jgi:hypothetical protein
LIAWFSIDIKLFLFNEVLESIESHIKRFGIFTRDDVRMQWVVELSFFSSWLGGWGYPLGIDEYSS